MRPGTRCPVCFRWVPTPDVAAHIRAAHPEELPFPDTVTTGQGGTVTDYTDPPTRTT